MPFWTSLWCPEDHQGWSDIAKHIEFSDRFMNMGAQLVRQVAGNTNDVSGDGTTTATVLTRAIYSGAANVAAGMNPMDLKVRSFKVESGHLRSHFFLNFRSLTHPPYQIHAHALFLTEVPSKPPTRLWRCSSRSTAPSNLRRRLPKWAPSLPMERRLVTFCLRLWACRQGRHHRTRWQDSQHRARCRRGHEIRSRLY